MSAFSYHRPANLVEALELLGLEGSVPLAGGTDLVVAIRHRKTSPEAMVDLKSVVDIEDGIDIAADVIRIGARAVMSRLIRSESINEHFPALVEAASVVGSVQIRNRATLAGNLCNGSPAADTVPALLAHSASVNIRGMTASRTVPLAEFFLGPGMTALTHGEVLTSVEIPIPRQRIGSAFARVTRRRGVDLASVNVACAVDDSGSVKFGFGAVGPTPLVADASVQDLVDDDGWSRLLSVATPISDVRASAEYRRAMLEVHAKRALKIAVDRLGAGHDG